MPFRRPWALERGALWAQDLALPANAPEPPRPGMALSELSFESAPSLATAMGLADAGTVRDRFKAGRRAFAASSAAQIVAYAWVSQGVECIGELERHLELRDGEAYIWDCGTLPQFRRQGLYISLLRYVVATLRGEGIQRAWIGASIQNVPSIRAFARAGFQPVLTLTYVHLFAFRRLRVQGDRTASPALIADAKWSLGIGGRSAHRERASHQALRSRVEACAEKRGA